MIIYDVTNTYAQIPSRHVTQKLSFFLALMNAGGFLSGSGRILEHQTITEGARVILSFPYWYRHIYLGVSYSPKSWNSGWVGQCGYWRPPNPGQAISFRVYTWMYTSTPHALKPRLDYESYIIVGLG